MCASTSEIEDEKKMSKGIEENIRWKDLHDISVHIGILRVKSKIMITTKWAYPLPLSTVFLVAKKLPSLLGLFRLSVCFLEN